MKGKQSVSDTSTPPTHSMPVRPATARARTRRSTPPSRRLMPRSRNQDWWPKQVDVSVLHAKSKKANPFGDDLDYAEEFGKLDVDPLKGLRHRC